MATAAVAADAAPVPAKGKKKLILIVVAALVLVLGGGGAFFVMKKKAAAAEEGADGEEATHAPAAHKGKAGTPPTFVPLDPFVVNLADRESDRYAQIGITLEIDEPAFADQLKAYMPAIRNGILMVLAHKTSGELLEREGKLRLADEIMRAAVRPLGIEIDEEEADEAAKAADDEAPKKKKKKKKAAQVSPIKHVHFSNFIIQ